MQKEKRITLILDEELHTWIQKQMDNREFESQSAGIRKCILIAKRVFERGNDTEWAKFIHGKDKDTK